MNRNDRFAIILGFIIILIISVPYILGELNSGDELFFTGFLLNPLDGNSYYAKMQIGVSGGWKFHLPYTPEVGDGAYLFIFYIFLGHISRITGLGIRLVFHIARLGGAVFLLFVLYRFVQWSLGNRDGVRLSFAVLVAGSGLGWIAALFGGFTPDFWVAEGFPFLSMYSNPHFPIGLALVLLLILMIDEKWEKKTTTRSFLAVLFSLLLSIINPFGIVIVLMVYWGLILIELIIQLSGSENPLRSSSFLSLLLLDLSITIGGLPFLIYDLIVSNTDPLLRIWNQQNLTETPGVFSTLLALSPLIVLAVYYCVKIFKRHGWNLQEKILIAWFVLGLILLYIPLTLQRRFMMGIYIPIGILGGMAFMELNASKKPLWSGLLFLTILPTNLIILMSSIFGVMTKDPILYLTRDEIQVMEILRQEESINVVLSGPESGLFIPAFSGKKVIYGHPYESIYSEERQELVTDFFKGEYSLEEELKIFEDYQIDRVYFGPREQVLGQPNFIDPELLVDRSGSVRLYQHPGD